MEFQKFLNEPAFNLFWALDYAKIAKNLSCHGSYFLKKVLRNCFKDNKNVTDENKFHQKICLYHRISCLTIAKNCMFNAWWLLLLKNLLEFKAESEAKFNLVLKSPSKFDFHSENWVKNEEISCEKPPCRTKLKYEKNVYLVHM